MENIVDVAIIGGGVVGSAVFRELVLQGYNVVLLEKNANFIHGASSGNSGIACTGYDAPVDSIERKCIRRAMELNPKVYRDLGLPSAAVGSLVVAWNSAEYAALPRIVEENHAIGDHDVRILSKEELYSLEPHLAQGASGAVFVPGEIVIEPWLIPIAYIHHGILNGGDIRLNHQVVHGEFHHGCWTLHCTNGNTINARAVINCAGLYGDIVDRIRAAPAPFEIRPRKGQYIVFDAPSALILRVIQPVPTDRTKGVFLFRNLYGHIIVGPTAEDQEARDVAENTTEVLQMLQQVAINLIPDLSKCKIVGSYAGLRPATEHRDYQIHVDPSHHWITVGGIRSTGVTASLGIAEHVATQLQLAKIRGIVVNRSLAPIQYSLPSMTEIATTHFDAATTTLTLDGLQHQVTHPLSRWGLQKMSQATARL